jgi:hypothetical protein
MTSFKGDPRKLTFVFEDSMDQFHQHLWQEKNKKSNLRQPKSLVRLGFSAHILWHLSANSRHPEWESLV